MANNEPNRPDEVKTAPAQEVTAEKGPLPVTAEEVRDLLKRIHVHGARYEEIFITVYETDIPGLRDCLGEHESIDELNYLGSLLDKLEEWETEKIAAVDFGEYNSVKDLINPTQNLNCFEFYTGIENKDGLDRCYIEEMCTLEISEYWENYIDYEAYGRDMSLDEDGHFTESGCVVRIGDSFTEIYSDGSDIPDEYRILLISNRGNFLFVTLKQCQQIIDSAPVPQKTRTAPAGEER